MTYKELYEIRKNKVDKIKYKMLYFSKFNYSILKDVMYLTKQGRYKKTVNDIIIMADTETSKSKTNPYIKLKDGTIKYKPVMNYVVAWTLSINLYGHDLVTLYGRKPSDLVETIWKIHHIMNGESTYIFYHNLSYDWTFLRSFFMTQFGEPKNQLNIKSHYPLYIEFENQIILRDSLILAQRSLEKWAKDLDVDHKKAVGKWDYNKKRNQDKPLSKDEVEYIECDTLAGVECIYKTCQILNKTLVTLPYTSTGIPRGDIQKIGRVNKAKENFDKQKLSYEYYKKYALNIFHGGYSHGNRHLVNHKIEGITKDKDFTSSYPFVMLSEKFPCGQFYPIYDCTVNSILDHADNYAFMFKLILQNPRLKNYDWPMPALQFSKAKCCINPILDNGRILECDYIEIYLNEIDLEVINNQYIWDGAAIIDCVYTDKDYLPRWFTEYIYNLYVDKCKLKGKDPVLYALAKAKLNSCYGMCVQKTVKESVIEMYLTGDYITDIGLNDEEEYNKVMSKRNTLLPYQWGCWVTSYAFRNLFRLGECTNDPVHDWIYSDTDSVYGQNWVQSKLDKYNQHCKDLLLANGYDAVRLEGKEYWLGVADTDPNDDVYTEFKVMGAKRYCGRRVGDNKLHITVAGVPKCGADQLNDNIDNFAEDFIFSGKLDKKNTHFYMYENKIKQDKFGNEYADSIDLVPCDYKLDSIIVVNTWDELTRDDITLGVMYDKE